VNKKVFASLLRKPGGAFVQSTMVIATGSAIAQAIPVVLTPVLTRLYTPAEIGLLGLYTAFISFATNATTLGYSQAIVSGRDDEEGADLAVISSLIVLPMSLIGAAILLILVRGNWLGYGELPIWTTIAMAVSLILSGLYFTLRYWLVRVGEYRVISTATVAQSVGRMATQIVTGLAGFGWLGLALGEVIGRASGLGRMWRQMSSSFTVAASGITPSRIRIAAQRYWKFPALTAPSSMLNSLALVLPVPLITMMFGVTDAGHFTIASRVMQLPVAFIGVSVGDVFHSKLAQVSREQPERAEGLLAKVSGSLFLIGIVPLLIVAFFGSSLFSTILGEEWAKAGSIASVLVPWVLFQFAVSPVSRVVQIYQGQEYKFLFDVAAICGVLGSISLGGYRDWSLLVTCSLLGWTQAIVYGLYFTLLLRTVRKHKYINFVHEP